MARLATPRPLDTSRNESVEGAVALSLLWGTVKSSSMVSRWTTPDFLAGRYLRGVIGGRAFLLRLRRLKDKIKKIWDMSKKGENSKTKEKKSIKRFSYDLENGFGKCSLFVLSANGWKDQNMDSSVSVRGFPPKKTLIWRKHCLISQSCCSMTSKRSIDWFLESSEA